MSTWSLRVDRVRCVGGRPAKGPVDWVARVCGWPAKGQVDRVNCENLFQRFFSVMFWMTLGGTLANLFGLIWLCTRNILSKWFLVVILVFSDSNFTRSCTVWDNEIPSLYLCTKIVCLGIANLIPFVDRVGLYEDSGIAFDFGLDCFIASDSESYRLVLYTCNVHVL